MKLNVTALGFLLMLSLLAACSDEDGSDGSGPGDATRGQSLFSNPLDGGNSFACGTCHAITEPASDGFRRPGHPLENVTKRPSYKNGSITELREAVNTCVTEWMNGEALQADDQTWRDLEAFLGEQGDAETAEAISIQIVAPPSDLSGGDITAGQTFFNGACAVCHGMDATGTIRAPRLFGGRVLELDYIAERVRMSGRVDSNTYQGLTGGIMPFWGADRLSDEELKDVAAYINMISREAEPPKTDAGVPPNNDAGTVTGSCDSTHAKVGQTATLMEHFHNVGGTARIIDDCTIQIDNFTFDGTGIDVRLYGGLGGNYSDGFAMGDDLRRSGGYNGETLTFTLPEGRTLDSLDGVAVWCVPVGVSFGDGRFQ